MTDSFNVAVLTPSTGNCRMEYAQSLARLIQYFPMARVREGCAKQSLVTDSLVGSSIAANYENLILKFLKSDRGWTHFLFVEDDMGFEHDILHTLAQRKVPIVGANYTTNKGWPIRFTVMGPDGKTRIVTTAESSGIEEAGWIPQGVTLVERAVFEQIPRPWFMTEFRDDHYILQDQYFCEKARVGGFKCYVDHAASKKVWHVGPHSYRWNEIFEAVKESA